MNAVAEAFQAFGSCALAKRRNVLVVGLEPDEFECLNTLLGRHDFEVDRFPRARHALDLTMLVAFHLLVVRFPVPGMPSGDFIDALRHPDSPCRHSPLFLLAHTGEFRNAQQYIGRGVTRVLLLEDPEFHLETAVASCLQVAPRRATRLPTRIQVGIEGLGEKLVCQTENISSSGMLLATDRPYIRGTKVHFQIVLPGDDQVTIGTAEVVRRANAERDQIEGVGVRFVSFMGDSQTRISRFLERSGTPQLATA